MNEQILAGTSWYLSGRYLLFPDLVHDEIRSSGDATPASFAEF